MEIKLCAIAKNESPYLARWIHHHLYFGFSEILIYVNDTSDNSLNILEKISKSFPSVKYKVADDMLAESLSKNRNFQVDAYNDMYFRARNSTDYLMFLDIDEYWTPIDFEKKITDLINIFKHENFDAFSFSWMLDVPDHYRAPLISAIQPSIKMLRNNHVKTLLRLSNKIERISVHNHLINDGKYLLDNGTVFEELDSVEQHRKSKVSPRYFQSNINIIPDYFIFHSVYRSQAEYLVSLTRGRRHAADPSLFKTNRWGYVYDHSKPVLDFSINHAKLINYLNSHEEFVKKCEICEDLNFASLNFYKKYFRAREIVIGNPDEVSKYANLFKGLNIFDQEPQY